MRFFQIDFSGNRDIVDPGDFDDLLCAKTTIRPFVDRLGQGSRRSGHHFIRVVRPLGAGGTIDVGRSRLGRPAPVWLESEDSDFFGGGIGLDAHPEYAVGTGNVRQFHGGPMLEIDQRRSGRSHLFGRVRSSGRSGIPLSQADGGSSVGIGCCFGKNRLVRKCLHAEKAH